MKAVLIDDERLARVELRRLLASHPEVEIAGEAQNAAEALAVIAEVSPDLLFLDIQLPGTSGFGVLELLDDVPQVIFTTAFDKYAIKAFEVNALDYLLKPIAPDRLATALHRVIPRKTSLQRLSQVFVRDRDRCWLVRVADISVFESEGNYTRVNFAQERPLIRRSLDALEGRLDPALFFRASRKQIINLAWVEKIDVNVPGGFSVALRDGRTVEMSRRQADRLRDMLSL